MRIEVSLCICTRNRPEELRRALASATSSTEPPVQIVVSDDGDDPAQVRELLEEIHLSTTYVEGPRSGLGANRNSAVAAATGQFVLFLDDDAELTPDFLAKMSALITQLPAGSRARTIVTGAEINRGVRVVPNEQDLLGFQTRPYRDGEQMQTVVVNAALFPRILFGVELFDPQLTYGYDEVDLTTRAVAAGFEIVPNFDAVNLHNPSVLGRAGYSSAANASRLYITLKRRRWTDCSPVKAWFGFGLACAHLGLASVRRSGSQTGAREAREAIVLARDFYLTYRRRRSNADR
jgi:glycosyltransferase involved in cell wall biosynthesis